MADLQAEEIVEGDQYNEDLKEAIRLSLEEPLSKNAPSTSVSHNVPSSSVSDGKQKLYLHELVFRHWELEAKSFFFTNFFHLDIMFKNTCFQELCP